MLSIFFYFSKMAKTVFYIKIVKKNFKFLFILGFKKNKEQDLFQVKPLKMSNIFLCVLILGLFWDFRGFLRLCFAMCRVKKQQIKVKFWIWGPRTVYYNMTCAPIFLNQKSLHPNVYLALGIHILKHFLNFVLRYGSSRSSIDILENWKRIIYIKCTISSSFELFMCFFKMLSILWKEKQSAWYF